MEFYGYWLSVTIIGIMISVAGISYGLGYAFSEKKLKDFGRDELYQSLINGVIVGALIAAFSSGGIVTIAINGSFSGISYPPCASYLSYNSAICFAHDYLAGLTPVTINGNSYQSLLVTSTSALVPLALLYAGLSLISSIKFNALLFSIGFSGMLKPILSQLSYIINAITISIISIEVQDALLKFIAATGITVLLPAGIILRTFFLTRRLGGAIMAVAIALFAVFPMSYLLSAELVSSYSAQLSQQSISSMLGEVNATQSRLSSTDISSSGNTIGTSLSSELGSMAGALISGVEGLVSQLMGFIAFMVISIFFLPVFSIILTITSARELARILGSEISFHKFDIF